MIGTTQLDPMCLLRALQHGGHTSARRVVGVHVDGHVRELPTQGGDQDAGSLRLQQACHVLHAGVATVECLSVQNVQANALGSSAKHSLAHIIYLLDQTTSTHTHVLKADG